MQKKNQSTREKQLVDIGETKPLDRAFGQNILPGSIFVALK